MRTREKGYSDYGISDAEVKELIQKSRTAAGRSLMQKAAFQANPELAEDLIYSIVNDLSYDRICIIRDIPAKKDDFYAYRRKAMSIFRDMIRELSP